jgi:hypothetical protein
MRRDLADGTMRDGLLSVFRALSSNERIHSIPDIQRKPLDLVLGGAGVGYPASLD